MQISRIGFGCVRLTSCESEKAAIRTLETAFDSGITHFDTARIYGLGHSERILGTFLKGKRTRATVATKFGFMPSAGVLNQRVLIRTVKKALAPFPKLLALADTFARGQTAASHTIPRGSFDLERTKKSIEQSLKALGTDYIDVLLMHEANAEDARSDQLLEFLNTLVARGTVRSFGVASDFGKFGADADAFDPRFRILQFNHDAAAPTIDAIANTNNRFILTFQHLAPMRALRERFHADPHSARALSDQIGIDVLAPQKLASLLQQYALMTNPGGAILFSSTSPDNIRENASQAEGNAFSSEQLEGFASFVRSGTASVAVAAPTP